MTDWLPGTSTDSSFARVLLLLLLIVMPLWAGATSSLARLVLLFGCLLLLLLLVRHCDRCYRPPGLFPLLLFCLWLLLQLVPLPPVILKLLLPGYTPQLEQGLWLLTPECWHPLSLYPAATFAEFLRFTAYLAFYLAATNLLIAVKGQKRLLLWLAGFFGLYAFVGLMQFFAPTERIFWIFSPWPEGSRFFASYVNSNHYAGLLGMVFPLLIVCLLLNVPPAGYGSLRERLVDIFTDNELNRAMLLGLAAIIAAISVFFSLSRTGIFGLFASSLFLLLLLAGREQLRGRMLIFMTVLISAVGLLAFFGWEPLLERFALTFNAAGVRPNLRLNYWFDSVDLFRAAPLTGSGAGTFIDAYPAWQTAVTNDLVVDHAHNDYLELLTDLGLIGFFLVLWFWSQFLSAVILAWRQRRNQQARLICAGCFAGLCAILLHSFTDFNLAIPANGLYLFLLFALLAAASHSRSGRGRKTTQLPVFSGSATGRIFMFSAATMILILLVAGGEELATARFTLSAGLDLLSAEPEQLDEVKTAAATAALLAPLQSRYPFASGLVQGMREDLAGSLAHYRQAVWRRPLYVAYQLQAARTLFAMQRLGPAEKLLQNTLLLKPFNWTSYRELASFYLASGRQAEGLQLFKLGLNLRPDKTSEVLQTLIVAGVRRIDFFAAMPQRSRSWAILGDFLYQLDEFDAAERAYRRGLESSKEEVPVEDFIFWQYLDRLREQQRNAEALELLRTALELFPQDQYFLAHQGLLYEQEGLRDLAIEAYRASLLIDPRHDWVRKRLKRLDVAATSRW